ncbi:MAG: Lrp/AsnC family transcriptional regulator [Gammaproteobacteria bacterium]|nr:Lrp/AsnC family transcriptional regulator [Gammaproteobacteria bacterium]
MVTDQDIIRIMQAGLPLCPEPYASIAASLELDEAELLRRIDAMLRQGTIRRIGLVPNHYRIGYRYNAMTVWALDEDRIDAVGELFGAQASVSHCYKRPSYPPGWPYNLFAMVHGRGLDEINDKIAALKKLIGDDCRQSDVLFSEKILKKTGIRLKNRSSEHA